MVPTKGVEDAITSGEVPEQLGENFAEVVNIMASLLNSNHTPHVRLTQIHDRTAAPADARAATILSDPAKRRVFDVDVEDSFQDNSVNDSINDSLNDNEVDHSFQTDPVNVDNNDVAVAVDESEASN